MQLANILTTCTLATVLWACATPADSEDGANDSIADGKADATYSESELAGAVRVANELTLGELDDDVGLSSRAAGNIVAARPLASVEELDAVPYVGPVAFSALVSHARELGWIDALPALSRFDVPELGNRQFGRVIAASETAVAVGIAGADYERGRVYVYERGAAGLQAPVLLPHPGAIRELGSSVAIAGDMLAATGYAGVPSNPVFQTFIYRRLATGWTLQQTLDGGQTAVAMDDDFLAVSDVDLGIVQAKGRVAVYYDAGGAFAPAATLAPGPHRFGDSVALHDSLLVIGAEEAGTYVWDLAANELPAVGLKHLDVAASSVAATRDRVAVGTLYGDDRIELFERDGDTWTHTVTIPGPAAATSYADFGTAIGINEDMLVVGVAREALDGAVYTYGVDGSLRQHTPAPAARSRFGMTVAVSGDTVAIGAPLEDDRGAVYAH